MTEGHFEVIQPKYIIQNSILDKKMIQGHMAHDMGQVWPQGLGKNGREVNIWPTISMKNEATVSA